MCETAPLGRLPGADLKRGIVELYRGTFGLDRERDGLLAEVPEVGVIDGLSRSCLAESFDGMFLCTSLSRPVKNAKSIILASCRRFELFYPSRKCSECNFDFPHDTTLLPSTVLLQTADSSIVLEHI